MTEQPTLQTERLLLRPLDISDAVIVQKLAGNRDVALQTMNIPYPYEDGLAEEWISSLSEQFAEGKSATFAIAKQAEHNPAGELIGAIGLIIDSRQGVAELGYWLGKPFWGNGYCSEAAKAMLAYGFDQLGLRRIQAHHFSRNERSGRVMRNIGMTHEGHMREYARRGDEVHDIEYYGILSSEFVQERLEIRS